MSKPPLTNVGWLSNPPLQHPALYTAFVFSSAMDIMLTWVILYFEGTEVNPVAALVIDHWGLKGAIVFKFSLTVFVIVVCEIVGRQRARTAWALAIAAVLVSSAPVVWSIILLYNHAQHIASPM